MAADLDDVVFELKNILEELSWHKNGSTAKMILEALNQISSLDDVVFELKNISEELSWHKDSTTANMILEALKKISGNIYSVESRLQIVEQTIREH